MQEQWNAIVGFFDDSEFGAMLVRALVLLVVGVVLARVVRTAIRRVMARRTSADHSAVVSRLAYSLMLVVVGLVAARQLGFDMSVLLGAAGILTVALGFASQASASNLISGLFLLGERPFVVGDVITVGGTTGEVVSIDLLSVKLRTFDNLYVREPNETLLKSEITTLTRYPIRRLDLVLGVAYSEDLAQVRSVLEAVTGRNPVCLDEPRPTMFFRGFAESAQEVQLSVWVLRENFVDLKNTLPEEIKRAFDEADIEIPFPHRTLHVGPATEPIPVRIVGASSRDAHEATPPVE